MGARKIGETDSPVQTPSSEYRSESRFPFPVSRFRILSRSCPQGGDTTRRWASGSGENLLIWLTLRNGHDGHTVCNSPIGTQHSVSFLPTRHPVREAGPQSHGSLPETARLPKKALLAIGRRRPPIGSSHVLVRQNAVARFATVAVWTAAVDLITKQIALAALSDQGVRVSEGIRLTLAHNNASAFGIWLGPLTWHINVVLTLTALVLASVVCRHLTAIDRRAPLMLGLIAGAAVGNLSSMILSPIGVVDFIAVGANSGQRLVFNIADVAAYLGVAMSIRTVFTISRGIQQRRVLPMAEIEIPIHSIAEPVPSRRKTPGQRRLPPSNPDISLLQVREPENNARA